VLVGTEELARPLSLTPASGFAEQQEQRVGESLTGKLRRRRGGCLWAKAGSRL
jgi:hypothetical protein